MIIRSLYFVEGCSTKPEIRFGFHFLYEHRGQLLHGFNRCYLLVGMDITKFIFTQYAYQLENILCFRMIVNMTVQYGVCYSLVALYINYKAKEQQYQKEIGEILELDLPAVMPTFSKSRVHQQPHGNTEICK